MRTEKLLEVLRDKALKSPIGMGDPFLESRMESWAPYLRFMYHCVQAFGMRLVLELGTYNGTCAAHMASANPYTHVITVDVNPRRGAFEAAEHYRNITVLTGDSCDFHDAVASEGLLINMLFLDTMHDGITPRLELDTYKDLLAEVSFVVVDDLLGPTHLERVMMDFWNELPDPKVLLHELHPKRDGVVHHDAPGFGVCVWT